MKKSYWIVKTSDSKTIKSFKGTKLEDIFKMVKEIGYKIKDIDIGKKHIILDN